MALKPISEKEDGKINFKKLNNFCFEYILFFIHITLKFIGLKFTFLNGFDNFYAINFSSNSSTITGLAGFVSSVRGLQTVHSDVITDGFAKWRK